MSDGLPVLVVEDDRDLLELTLMGLEREGFDAHGATDVETAVKEMVRHSFGALVIDLHIPGGGGQRVCACASVLAPDAGIVLVSGDRGAYDLAIDERVSFMLKPVRTTRLAAHLRELGLPATPRAGH